MLSFTQTQKGKRACILLGYEYRFIKEVDGVNFWRCREDKQSRCKGTLRTIGENICDGFPTEHSHDSAHQMTEVRDRYTKMKKDIKETGATARRVISNNSLDIPVEVRAYMPSQRTMSRTLNRIKQGNVPNNPHNLNFVIPQQYRNKIVYDSGSDDPDRILIMADRDLLNELVNHRNIFGDGTFSSCPRIFFQLYTLSIEINRTFIPCIYILLRTKTTVIYVKMIRAIRTIVPAFNPQTIMLDYEKAVINAFQQECIGIEIKACFFHLNQSLNRKIAAVGLKTDYENIQDVKILFRSLASLAFVPVNDIVFVFDELCTIFPQEIPHQCVLKYFQNTYIESEDGGPLVFPPRFRNQ